jgi:hypothetical protein
VSTCDTCPNQNADSRKSSYPKEYVKIVYSVMGRKYLHCHVVTRRRRRPRAQRSIFREIEIVYNRTCRVGSDPKSVNGDKLPHTNFQHAGYEKSVRMMRTTNGENGICLHLLTFAYICLHDLHCLHTHHLLGGDGAETRNIN